MIRPFFTARPKDDGVEITIDSMLPVERHSFSFDIRCARDIDAIALANHLRYAFARMVREAREKAYLAGYSDGRAKRGKTQWHDHFLGVRP